MGFMEFFKIINYQNMLGNNINQTALSIARYSYSLDKSKGLLNDTGIKEELGLSNELIISGINMGYAKNKIFTEELKVYTEKVDIVNGMKGISIITSSFDKNGDGVNDIRINYRINANVIGNTNFGFRLTNRCYFRSWIGKSIRSDSIDNNSDIKQEKVYITKNSKVFHLSKKCTHINIVVTKVLESKINNFRNSNGAKYYKCELCTKNSDSKNGEVYITAEGKRYHFNQNCGRIERTVIEIDKSEINDKKLCDRCKKDSKFDS